MRCQIQFFTDKKEYIINSNQIRCENIQMIYKWLRDCGGILSTRDSYGFTDIFKVYIKWYDISTQREYSCLNDFRDIEFKFSIDYKDIYFYESSFCIECSIYIDVDQSHTHYIWLCFNIIMDTKLNILGIDPCCNSDIIITRCILHFDVMEYRKLLFYNEI